MLLYLEFYFWFIFTHFQYGLKRELTVGEEHKLKDQLWNSSSGLAVAEYFPVGKTPK